ncbi:hypothetical protein AMAG_16924 [Allomyces macrogynus ATCC 38327]|uniref:ABC transporter domain-containing protein n=1 Tax=Allomyces macrogynus (strain ATCC 38327) TaxID=578462 RepID=A0A0L0TDR2_ALLM3|nr:hypothetical protein AMAG_16924 [Allomyces macrogynus ATCC 38327]|eukprot:KNE72820.1 hypothetical protein AMAG_16924 [Allomyces macrogynus ATCC 38327]
MARFLAQVAALLRKNALILQRSPFQLALAVLSPLIFLLVAALASTALSSSFSATGAITDTSHPAAVSLTFPKCTNALGRCRPRLLYAPNDVYHARIMHAVADGMGLSSSSTDDVRPFATLDELAQNLLEQQIKLTSDRDFNFGIGFTTFFGTDAPKSLDEAGPLVERVNGTHYSILTVESSGFFSSGRDMFLPGVATASPPLFLKTQLDRAIIKTRSEMKGKSAPSLEIKVSGWPTPENVDLWDYSAARSEDGSKQNANEKASTRMGNAFTAAFLFFGYCPMFLIIMSMIGSEKYMGLLAVLRKLGMSEAAYWVASFVTLVLLVVVSALLSMLAIPAYPVTFPLSNASAAITFVVQFAAGLQLVSFGLVLVAGLTQQYAVNALAGLLLMASILCSGLLGFLDSVSGAGIMPKAPSGFFVGFSSAPALGWILEILFPVLAHGKLVFDVSSAVPLKNETLTWTHARLTTARTYFSNKVEFTASTTIDTVLLMCLVPLVYVAVAWYLAQVVGGAQRFWGPIVPSSFQLSVEESIRFHALAKENDELVVEDLRVTYGPKLFKCRGRKSHEAVKGVSFAVRRGQVLSLLGTNGAGKSTVINAITGQLRPTSGRVSCFGTGHMATIQKRIGVTAQHDYTWPALTAAEHIELFASFRGIPATEEYILDRLQQARTSPVISQRSKDMLAVTVPATTQSAGSAVVPLLQYLQSDDASRVALFAEFNVQNTSLEQVFLNVAGYGTAGAETTLGDETTALATASDVGKKKKKQKTKKGKRVEASTVPPAEDTSFELPSVPIKRTLPSQLIAVFLKNLAYQAKQTKSSIAIILFTLAMAGLCVFILSMSNNSTKVCPGGYFEPVHGKGCSLGPLKQKLVDSVGKFAPSPANDLGALATDFQFGPASSAMAYNGSRYWLWDQSPGGNADRLITTATPTNWTQVAGQWRGSVQSELMTKYYLPDLLHSQPVTVTKVDRDPIDLIRDTAISMSKSRSPLPDACVEYSSRTKAFVVTDPKSSAGAEYTKRFPDAALSVRAWSDKGMDVTVNAPLSAWNAQSYFTVVGTATDDERGLMCKWVAPNAAKPPSDAYNTLRTRTDKDDSDLNSESSWGPLTSHDDMALRTIIASLTTAQLRATLDSKTEQITSVIQDVPAVAAPVASAMIVLFTLPFSVFLLFAVYLLIPFDEKENGLLAFYRVNGLSLWACWLGHYLFNIIISLPTAILVTVVVALYFPNANVGMFLLVLLVGVHGLIALAFLLASLIGSLTVARLASFLFPPIASILSAALVINQSSMSWAIVLFPPLPFLAAMNSVLVSAPVQGVLLFVSVLVACAYIALAIVIMTALEGDLVGKVGKLIKSGQAAKPQEGIALRDLERAQSATSFGEDEDAEVRAEREALIKDPSGPSSAYAVKVVDLYKSFGKKNVLECMHLGIKPGVVFGLTGHNGSGKSTLLNILMGALRATAGQAFVGGLPVTSRDLCGVLGVCPQADLVLGDLTVEENLLFFARVRGAPLRGADLTHLVHRCAEIIGLGSPEVLRRAARQLSGGMRRRLAIGVAVIGSPAVIIIDEGSAGLDPANRLGVWKLIGRIRDRGDATILLTTHYMSEADALCTRIAIMAGGRVRVLGNQVALKQAYGKGYNVQLQVPVVAKVDPANAERDAIAGVVAALGAHVSTPGTTTTTTALAAQMQDLPAHLADQRMRGGTLDASTGMWTWQLRVMVPLPAHADLARVFAFLAASASDLGVAGWGINPSSLEDVFIRVSTRYYLS